MQGMLQDAEGHLGSLLKLQRSIRRWLARIQTFCKLSLTSHKQNAAPQGSAIIEILTTNILASWGHARSHNDARDSQEASHMGIVFH